eukprot:g78746.t1
MLSRLYGRFGTKCRACRPGRMFNSAAPANPPPLFAEQWAAAVERFGQRSVLVYGGGTAVARDYSYNELESRANRVARSLRNKYGVKAGDRVVTAMYNRPEIILLNLACHKLGAIFTPLSHNLLAPDLIKMVQKYEPAVVVTTLPIYFPKDRKGKEWPTIFLPDYSPAMTDGIGYMETDKNVSDQPFAKEESGSDHDKCAMIFSTSGTLGIPKGVMYSGRTCAELGQLVTTMKANKDPVWSLTNDHDTQLLYVNMRGAISCITTMAFMIHGVRSIMVAANPSGPKDWAPLIDQYNITQLALVGAAMNEFQTVLPGRTFPSVKTAIYGGSPFPVSLVQRSMAQFPNAKFAQGYGQTECFLIAGLGPEVHDRTTTDPKKLHVMSSAGPVSALAEVFIEDQTQPGSGLPPPPKAQGVGQICAKSPFLMMGYYRDPERTKEAIPDGKYIRTGDMGKLEDGLLYVLDRTKDIIHTYTGYEVIPKDIEDVMYKHPSVGQAAVIGIPHPSGEGDQLIAWVTAKDGKQVTASELFEHLRQQKLSESDMPSFIEISETPLPTHHNKIAKQLLRSPSKVRQQLMADLPTRVRMQTNRQSGTVAKWQAEARVLFERMDGDCSGYLDVQNLHPFIGQGNAEKFFKLVDTDRDRYISHNEWQTLLSEMDEVKRTKFLKLVGSLIASLEKSPAGPPGAKKH